MSKKWLKIIVFATVITLIFVCQGSFLKLFPGAQAAGITGAYYAPHRDLLLVSGSGFGAAQGGSSVTVDGTSLGAATSWSDTNIYYSTPAKNSGTITVNISGGSSYSSSISRLSTYTPYPSDGDTAGSDLVSYWPFDTNFSDVKGSNNLSPQNLALYGTGKFHGKYEAIQTFSDPTTNNAYGTGGYRNVITIGSQTLLMFYDGAWKYTISSDEGATWTTPSAVPYSYYNNYLGFPTQMENDEWLYLKLPPFPFHTFQFCHATGVTIDNVFAPLSLSCLTPIDFATLSSNWDWNGTTNTGVFYQWQYEYLGSGQVIWPIYKYFTPPTHHGAGIIRSQNFGHTWDFVSIDEGRTLSLTLASAITVDDTTITLTDTTGMYASGTIYIKDATNREVVSYGSISGNTLTNVRHGVANANVVEFLWDDRISDNAPGVRYSYAADAGTTVTQGSDANWFSLGEPSIVVDPHNANHWIMFQRCEGISSSYIYKSESTDGGNTWSAIRSIYLDSYTTGEPVRGNNFWIYWTANAGDSQGRIYLFARASRGTKYFYSDDSSNSWHGSNAAASTVSENNYTMRTGNTSWLANNQNNVIEAPDKSGLWFYWDVAIDDALVNVTGAGDSNYNDAYQPVAGTYNGKTIYRGVTHGKCLWWDTASNRWVLSTNNGDILANRAYGGTVGAALPSTPWAVINGTAPAPSSVYFYPGSGTDRTTPAKSFLSYSDSTSGKNLGYAYDNYSSSYNLSQYSIDFWADIRQTYKYIDGTIVSRMSADGAKANYDIKIIGNGANQNKIQFRQYNDLTSSWDTITSTTAFSNDTWYHIAATYDGAKMRLYINGVLETEGNSISTHSGSEKLQIGYDQSVDELLFRGQLDNLKIWSKALSDSEVLLRSNWIAPSISAVVPSTFYAGDTLTISGSGFGATQSGSTITVGGVAATVISWSDTEIVVIAPVSLTAGIKDVLVNIGGFASNSSSVTVQDRPGSGNGPPPKKPKKKSSLSAIISQAVIGPAEANEGKKAESASQGGGAEGKGAASSWWYFLIPAWILIMILALKLSDRRSF